MAEQAMAESDAMLAKGGARLHVTDQQIEKARQEMEEDLAGRATGGEVRQTEKATPAEFYGFVRRNENPTGDKEVEVVYFVLASDDGTRKTYRAEVDGESYTTGPRIYVDETTYQPGMEVLKSPIKLGYLSQKRKDGEDDGFEGMVFTDGTGQELGRIGTEYRSGGTVTAAVMDINSRRLGGKG